MKNSTDVRELLPRIVDFISQTQYFNALVYGILFGPGNHLPSLFWFPSVFYGGPWQTD
jgi:hypothetical protein